MITHKDLLKYSKTSVKKLEVIGPFSKIDYFNGKTLNPRSTSYKFCVGIELKSNVYYWWECIVFEVEHFDGKLIFNHRYNTANGAVQKGFTRGFEAQKLIENAISQSDES